MDSYAYPYQSRGTRAKLKAYRNEEFQKLNLQKKIRETAYHPYQVFDRWPFMSLKALFIFHRPSQTAPCIKLKPSYVEGQGPNCFGMVSIVTFRTADTENIGDIHRVSKAVFSLSSYILVLRYDILQYHLTVG